MGSPLGNFETTVLVNNGSLNGARVAGLFVADGILDFLDSSLLTKQLGPVMDLDRGFGRDMGLDSGAGFARLESKEDLLARKSSILITESTSTSLPPKDKKEPGSNGELHVVLPISRPEIS